VAVVEELLDIDGPVVVEAVEVYLLELILYPVLVV
jgi:hypothetical protein